MFRRLAAISFLFLSVLFFGVSLYGFSVAKSATEDATAVFVLLISAIFLLIGLWILRVRFLRRLALMLGEKDSSRFETLDTLSRSQDAKSTAQSETAEIEPLEKLFATLEGYPTYRFSDIQEKWLPNSGGVYVIYDSRGPLYVGRTGNLYRRIKLQHYSGERDYSSFRSLLMDRLSITKEAELTNYLKTCKFRFIILPDENQQKDLEHYAKIRLKPFINN